MAGWRDRVLPGPALWLVLEHFGLFGSVVAWEPHLQSRRERHTTKAMPEPAATAGVPCGMSTVVTMFLQRESPTWTAPSNNHVGFNNEQSTSEQRNISRTRTLGWKPSWGVRCCASALCALLWGCCEELGWGDGLCWAQSVFPLCTGLALLGVLSKQF